MGNGCVNGLVSGILHLAVSAHHSLLRPLPLTVVLYCPHLLQGMEDGSSDEGEEGDGDGMDMDSDGLEEDGEGESDEDGLEGLGSDLEKEEDGGRGRQSGKSVGEKSGKSVGKSGHGLHPVEDRFMRLSEMEAFLQEAEEKAAGGDEEEEEEEAEEGEEDEDEGGDEDGSGDEDCEYQCGGEAVRHGTWFCGILLDSPPLRCVVVFKPVPN